MRRLGRVPRRWRLEAIVAVAARFGLFAEVSEQFDSPASVGLGQGKQCVELVTLDLLPFRLRGALLDQPPLLNHVGEPVDQKRSGREAIAPGAAGLLVVALDVFWEVEMGDEPDVGLVDPHAKGDGGDDHDAIVEGENVLVDAARVLIKPGVIGERGNPGGEQPARDCLDLLPR